MMKQFTAIMMVLTLLITGATSVFAAEEQPEGMEKATVKFLKDEYYDFKNGTVDLSTVEKFEVTPPAEEGKEAEGPITVYAALADFQTVRDNIFTFDHKETVYFNATEGVMLTATEVGKLKDKGLTAYSDQFEHLGKQMNLGWILFLHSLLLIVPAFFMYIWGKQVYSTSRYMIKNNLYNQHHTFN
ncbi:hypothetical protein [Pseudalkalibacillus decolorationis]|uniref:hypothetical protein n=1 Tax=Pseudalkalibacillus decolorationis TaxID=163879 RepID=UPI0021473119|nr:hypothetical protein [Pseudalkalibacillus decolorationis]